MPRLNKIILTVLLIATAAIGVTAQRRVTPVEPPATQKKMPDAADTTPQGVVHMHAADGRVVLVDTVTGIEYVDSTAMRIPRMIYPTIYRVTAGVNIWDAAMRCIGQKYGIGSVWGELNMHNRYFPRLEIGLGEASISPTASNYTFRSPLSPYFKIGAAYNIFYNSDPSYQFLVGINYGFTPFRFGVDATVSDSYWGETTTINIPTRAVTAGYFELTLGVKVKIAGPVSMGWTAIWHSLLHESRCPQGKPMYIPGYGKRGNSFTATLSVMYTFDLNKPTDPAVTK